MMMMMMATLMTVVTIVMMKIQLNPIQNNTAKRISSHVVFFNVRYAQLSKSFDLPYPRH